MRGENADRRIGRIRLANLPARTDRPRRLGIQTNDRAQQVESASVNLESGMHFVGDIDGFRVDTDADEGFGGASVHSLAFSAVRSSRVHGDGRDLHPAQKRQRVSGLEVEARGSRVEEHPKVYETIEVVYRVRGKELDPRAVEGASELSKTRYCPAIAMVGKAARIESRYEIEEVD